MFIIIQILGYSRTSAKLYDNIKMCVVDNDLLECLVCKEFLLVLFTFLNFVFNGTWKLNDWFNSYDQGSGDVIFKIIKFHICTRA